MRYIIARHSEHSPDNGIPKWWLVNLTSRTAVPWDGSPPAIDLDPLYPDRQSALNAEGDVRIHYKQTGIYRKECEVAVADGEMPDIEDRHMVLYEHLHPNPHIFWLRWTDMFEGNLPDGTPRFAPVR